MATKTLRRRIKPLMSKASRASTRYKKDITRYIKRKPYQSLGVLVATGACIAAAVTYLTHRHH